MNDSAYPAANDAATAGARVHLIDIRQQPDTTLTTAAENAGVVVIPGSGVLTVRERIGVSGAIVGPIDNDGKVREPLQTISCSVFVGVHLCLREAVRIRRLEMIAFRSSDLSNRGGKVVHFLHTQRIIIGDL